jgi:hypothetical protein
MKSFAQAMAAIAALSILAVPSRTVALPAAEAEAGRNLSRHFADAIVSVELVATIRMSAGDRQAPARELRLEPNGTVISPTGLTVTSLTEIDPRGAAEALTRNMNLPGGQRIQFGDSEYKEVKIRLANGTEIPANVVLKDADLDLAFIAPVPGDPVAAKQKFTWVNMDDPAEPIVLSDYFIISRAAKSLQRVPTVHAATIEGIVAKPRQLFIPSVSVIGCPMLNPGMHVLGLCLSRIADGHPVLVNGRPAAIILPAADVAEEARQAATAKPIQNPVLSDAPKAAPAAVPGPAQAVAPKPAPAQSPQPAPAETAKPAGSAKTP